MPGEGRTGTTQYGPGIGSPHFWRHLRHPVKNLKARWRKHIPFNFTTKIWKTELELRNLRNKERLYEERLEEARNRIKYLEAKTEKEAEKAD